MKQNLSRRQFLQGTGILAGTTLIAACVPVPAPGVPAQGGAQDPIAVVKALDAACNAADIEGVMALFADDAIVKDPAEPNKMHTGKQQIRAWFVPQLGHYQVTSRDHQVTGNTVTWRGTLTGDMIKQMGSEALEETGEAVVQGGKIMSFASTVVGSKPTPATAAPTAAPQPAQKPAVVATVAPASAPDLILVNGKVFTADPALPSAEAIAIGGERILAVGTTAQITALAAANTRRMDLRGRTVIPGINDAHYHSTDTTLGGHRLSFQGMEPSWQETQTALAEAVKQVPAGTWIFGVVGGIVATEPQTTRFALDRIAPDHPVYLLTYYGHSDIVNTKAMGALGIGEEEADPQGGNFERVPGSKRINGRIFEYAQWALWRRLGSLVPDADHIKTLQALAAEAVRYGVTTIQDMPTMPAERYVKLVQAAQLPIRLRLIRYPMTSANGRDLTEGRTLPLHPAGQPLLTVRGTKWLLDGTPFEWAPPCEGHMWTARGGRASSTSPQAKLPPCCKSRCNGTINCWCIARPTSRLRSYSMPWKRLATWTGRRNGCASNTEMASWVI